ncbi:MAG: nucleotidyltransferase domain-containing protein [Lachnospiraceae bacterium]|nr:nucleotidyltransferase domain-containing protein [Lachnospiraceae bacterium]
MEDQSLKEKCDRIIEKIKAQLYENRQCIAAYLLGSASHDVLWEWSDIQIAVILDDGYRGKHYYTLLEEGMYVALNVYTLTAFKEFVGTMRADDFMWKAFSKCTKIFSKDFLLDELMDDAFYVGDVDRQKEMLLGFSGAVYYLNKAEKNFYVKGNSANTIYFIPQIAENIAWIEIFKNREIPEREVIPQGKRLNPEVFEKIYDPLFQEDYCRKIKSILENCVCYLEQNTRLVYQPVLAYLEQHGNLEGFRYETRLHGFGINYEWLVRCGIARRYGTPEKIPFLKQAERLGYEKNE